MRWIKAPGGSALLSLALLSSAAGITTVLEPHPTASGELLRTAAGIGASFFLAFVVEATWLAPRVREDKSGERAMWVITGFAVCGLLGIVQLLAYSDRDPNSFSAYRLWWSLLALGFLGLMVCVRPALAHAEGSEGD